MLGHGVQADAVLAALFEQCRQVPPGGPVDGLHLVDEHVELAAVLGGHVRARQRRLEKVVNQKVAYQLVFVAIARRAGEHHLALVHGSSHVIGRPGRPKRAATFAEERIRSMRLVTGVMASGGSFGNRNAQYSRVNG